MLSDERIVEIAMQSRQATCCTYSFDENSTIRAIKQALKENGKSNETTQRQGR